MRQHRLLGHHGIGRGAGDPQRRQDREVKVYASGEGSQLDCDQINSGNFYKFLSYKATEQGHDLMMAAQTLLKSGDKPGTKNQEYYTQPVWLDKTNAIGANCFAVPKPPIPTDASAAAPKK